MICHEKPYNSLQDDFYILSCFESGEGRRSQESPSQESGVRSHRVRRKKEGRRKLPNYQLPITN
ncbi:hypothetical protein FJR06_03630, partial [Dolichospermum sp. UHCC 0352]|nr:hypothetical protein [Dolichospermum sp. UHCC 0352]